MYSLIDIWGQSLWDIHLIAYNPSQWLSQVWNSRVLIFNCILLRLHTLLGVKDTWQYRAEHVPVLMLGVYSSSKGEHGRDGFNISLFCCPYEAGHSVQTYTPRTSLQFTFTYQVQGNCKELEHNWTHLSIKISTPTWEFSFEGKAGYYSKVSWC